MSSLLSSVETVPLTALTTYPGNPRRGNIAAISESLAENQQFAPLVVQKSTGYVLSGNHTFAAASDLGWDTIAVVYVDVDDARAKKIVLAANRTADLARYDDEALTALLESLGGDFTGTGYSAEDLDDILMGLDAVPDLDALAAEVGEPHDADLWPVLRFKVSPQARSAFYELTDDAPDSSDDARFNHLLMLAGWDGS